MSDLDEAQYLRDTLEQGLHLICEAFGVSADHYDRDQADGECYLDCFRDAAEQIRACGVTFDHNEGEFTRPPSKPDMDAVRKAKAFDAIANSIGVNLTRSPLGWEVTIGDFRDYGKGETLLEAIECAVEAGDG